MDTAPTGPNKPTISQTTILFSLITLILGLALGFGTDRFLVQKGELKKAKDLPVSNEVIRNKVFTYWMGAVEGTLTKKDKESFTIGRNGDQLIIGIHPTLTNFLSETGPHATSSAKPTRYTLDQIPLGSKLNGSVNIYRENSGNIVGAGKNYIIGNFFGVEPAK